MNTEKIKQLQAALGNKHITPEMKTTIQQAIDKLQAEDNAKASKPAEAPVVKMPATKKTKQKQPKEKKAVEKTPSTKPAKVSVFAKAKEIRTKGEPWKDAQARARKMLNDDSKEKKEISHSEIDQLLRFIKSKKELRSLIGHTNLVRDAKRKAKPSGKRTSKEGNTYYENRENRTDHGKYGQWHLERGGDVWTKEQSDQVAVLDADFEKAIKKEGIERNSKAAADLWRSGGYRKRIFEIFKKNPDEASNDKYIDGGTLVVGNTTQLLNGYTGMDYTGLVGETNALSSGELFEKGGALGSVVELKKGYGYWDLTKHPYGGDFKRFKENVKGKFVQGTRKTGSQIVVLLDSGEKVVTDIQAINKTDYAAKDRLYQKNKHLFRTIMANGGDISLTELNNGYQFSYEVDEDNRGSIFKEHGIFKVNGFCQGKHFSETFEKFPAAKKYYNTERDKADQYEKGGAFTTEQRYVNKGEDYEKRYAKDKPHRHGYKKATSGMIVKKLFGGFGTKKPQFVGEQKLTKSHGMVQILARDDNKKQFKVMPLDKLGSGAPPIMIDIDEVIVEKKESGGKATSAAARQQQATALAKEIRTAGETWPSALSRAWTQLKSTH